MPEILLRTAASATSPLSLPRLLLVFAHPDDEVLALGARLERLQTSRLLTLTDGAPANGADALHHGFVSLEAYRAARRAELCAALDHAGLPPSFAPAFSAAVSDQTAALHLVSLARALHQHILDFSPEAILTHPYEGGHPDHDACAFAVHAAAQLAGRRETLPILEAPFYHAGEHNSMQTGTFLPTPHPVPAVSLALTQQEQENKAARLACFPSQAETLSQFGTQHEHFRLAPAYDFTQRPHAGQLFYERFPWGMNGDTLCQLAAQAREALFPSPLHPRAHKAESTPIFPA